MSLDSQKQSELIYNKNNDPIDAKTQITLKY